MTAKLNPTTKVLMKCARTLHRHGLTVDQLAQHVANPPATRRTQQDMLVEMASRPGGVSSREVMDKLGTDAQHASSILSRSQKRGRTTVWRVPGLKGNRWFANPEDGARWAASAQQPVDASSRRPAPAVKSAKPAPPHATKALPAPVTVPAGQGRLRGPADTRSAVITRDTKKRPTARWQMQQLPADNRWPKFADDLPGTDPATGKAWGAPA